MPINTVKGAADMLPSNAYKWKYVEKVISETAELYGYNKIRTPVFEYTELFSRSVGETTDVVQKEMYTFDDKGGRSITLRPEGTAGVVRSFIENGLASEPMPQKLFYITSCYRYEKPQAGRLREHHQFGTECFGAADPIADAETIMMAKSVLNRLGIDNISLEINSIGCPVCRAAYFTVLIKFFESKKTDLCATCLSRLERNPMRILDCKSKVCGEIAKSAPHITDYVCNDCNNHFSKVKSNLDNLDIPYKVNPRIVRGLDYYNRTVFEFLSNDIGSQTSVCSGGRYDGLVKNLGGQEIPALGFGMGLERIIMVMENLGLPFEPPKNPSIYIIPMGEKAAALSLKICTDLREEGFIAITDITGRSVKACMKHADKLKTNFTIVIGETELQTGEADLKNMNDGTVTKIKINEIISIMYDNEIDASMKDLEESMGDFDNL